MAAAGRPIGMRASRMGHPPLVEARMRAYLRLPPIHPVAEANLMSVCAETPRSSFERLAMRAMRRLPSADPVARRSCRRHGHPRRLRGIPHASGSHSHRTRRWRTFTMPLPGAVDPATDQPLILQSGAGDDGEEDEHPARRPSIPFADRQARVQVSHPGDPPRIRAARLFQARAPPAFPLIRDPGSRPAGAPRRQRVRKPRPLHG